MQIIALNISQLTVKVDCCTFVLLQPQTQSDVMFCSQCGAQSADNARFCASCGQTLLASQAQEVSVPVSLMSADNSVLAQEPQTSGKAIGSLICGFFSFLFPAAIVAIVLGHISRSEIRRSAGRLKGNGIALTGLIFGYLGTGAIPLLIISAIAIPNLLRARQAANEASAVGAVRTIITAEISYAAAYPDIGYTCRIADLAGQGGSPSGAGLIDDVLGGATKSGYSFTLSGCSASPNREFTVGAVPVVRGETGTRSFCASQNGVIKYDPKGSFQDCELFGEPLR